MSEIAASMCGETKRQYYSCMREYVSAALAKGLYTDFDSVGMYRWQEKLMTILQKLRRRDICCIVQKAGNAGGSRDGQQICPFYRKFVRLV